MITKPRNSTANAMLAALRRSNAGGAHGKSGKATRRADKVALSKSTW